MRKHTKYLGLLALAGLFLTPFSASAQDDAAAPAADDAAAPDVSTPAGEETPGAAAASAPADATTIDPAELNWNEDLKWISFIIDDGRVQSQRDYFGAITTAQMDSIVSGSSAGLIRVQQVFYYNPATRQFSRFDATTGNTIALLEKDAYFRAESFMRVVPLNRQFVENLAVQGFLNVEGD